jgi:hypothetical protein
MHFFDYLLVLAESMRAFVLIVEHEQTALICLFQLIVVRVELVVV